MGNNSTSTITNTNNVLMIDGIYLESMIKSLNDDIATTLINDAKQCSSNIIQLQSVKFKSVNVSGDFNLNPTPNQSVALTFDCLQLSTVRNKIADKMLSDLMDKIEQTNARDIKNQLEAMASAAWNSLGAQLSINAINFTPRNTAYQNLQNIVQIAIQNNFTPQNLGDCIIYVNNDQSISPQRINIIPAQNINGKYVTQVFAIDQNQVTTLVTQYVRQFGTGIVADLQSKLKIQSTNASGNSLVGIQIPIYMTSPNPGPMGPTSPTSSSSTTYQQTPMMTPITLITAGGVSYPLFGQNMISSGSSLTLQYSDFSKVEIFKGTKPPNNLLNPVNILEIIVANVPDCYVHVFDGINFTGRRILLTSDAHMIVPGNFTPRSIKFYWPASAYLAAVSDPKNKYEYFGSEQIQGSVSKHILLIAIIIALFYYLIYHHKKCVL